MARRNREFVHLASNRADAIVKKINVAGWYWSEKLDGMRAFWDGGISRGMDIESIPWANLAKSGGGHKATGLWSRYGKVIHAPDWFLDNLAIGKPLDGELWTGRGEFQRIVGITKRLPENALPWDDVKFMMFDMPSYDAWSTIGRINNPHYTMEFTEYIKKWISLRLGYIDVPIAQQPWERKPFFLVEHHLMPKVMNDVVVKHAQHTLPQQSSKAEEVISTKLAEVIADGGEGLILRRSESFWEPLRTRDMIKVTERIADEATIVGFTSAEMGKIFGKIGALVVQWKGKKFKLSGLSDAEREFGSIDAINWAFSNPDTECPSWVNGKLFRVGQSVTFRYRELTDDGVPKSATYWRNPDDKPDNEGFLDSRGRKIELI